MFTQEVRLKHRAENVGAGLMRKGSVKQGGGQEYREVVVLEDRE